MRKNKRTLGSQYEELAAAYLKNQGLKIIRKNYRVKSGEIDLIALDGEYLVFVEVKYRSSDCAGDSLGAVDAAKQRAISRTAVHYLASRKKNVNLPCRFDVVGIDRDEVRWIKNAFDYCG